MIDCLTPFRRWRLPSAHMEMTMLTFTEHVLKEIRKVELDTQQLVLGGAVSDMERYRYLMGRLEGLRLAENIVKGELDKHSED